MSSTIRLLAETDDRQSFQCEEKEMTRWLKRYAIENARIDYGVTRVAVEDSGSPVIKGYYTLSTSSVAYENLPEKEGLPRYPAPVVHLGRLARDLRFARQGVGEELLFDALARTKAFSEEIGIVGMEIKSLPGSLKFYLRFGFQQLLDDEHHLYLPISTIRKLDL